MKKVIISLLFIGSCLITKAQSDICKVDYYNMFRTDTVVAIYGNTDQSYLYHSDQIYNRYKDKLREVYGVDELFIHYVGDSWYDISMFSIERPNGGTVYITPCYMEEHFK
jgi:hypothetical protein